MRAHRVTRIWRSTNSIQCWAHEYSTGGGNARARAGGVNTRCSVRVQAARGWCCWENCGEMLVRGSRDGFVNAKEQG